MSEPFYTYDPDTRTYRFNDSTTTVIFDLATENTANSVDGLHVIGNDLGNRITGNDQQNSLDGGKGNDTLIGGSGNDTLIGGQGDDRYVITEGDTLIETYGGGKDTVELAEGYATDYTLQDNFENVEIIGNLDINVFGNSADNSLKGGAGNNSLEGGFGNDTLKSSGGIDTLKGGFGNDVYDIENDEDDILEESAGGGTDTVVTSRDQYVLLANFENLTLTGSAHLKGFGNDANNVLTGNDGDNLLEGREGSDTLSGGTGADTLAGGIGRDTLDGGAGADTLVGGENDDWYRVDNSDEIVETEDGGYDTVESSADYVLGANFEALKLTGNAITGTGNSASNYILGSDLNNRLVGKEGYDILDGGAGADTMDGGADSDTYIVDNARDVVIEAAGGGEDLIVTLIDYTLGAGAHVEKLEAAYVRTNLNLTGNELNNRVTGSLGANRIDGGRGADLMQGKAGDDTFIVDNALDVVEELAKEGRDTVLTSVSYRLAANAEIETLSALSPKAKTSLSLTGNAYANTIIGNAGKNKLVGGLGNDKLTGGKGTDAFIFNTKLNAKTNVDRIADFNVKDDTVQLSRAIFSKLKKGKLKKDAFWIGSKAHDKTDRIIYNEKKGALYYDADGSGKGKAVQFASLSKKLAMTEADFLVI